METKKTLEKPKNEEKVPGKNHYTNNSTVRMQRNQAEKQRRDRLNDQIAQLATLVPPALNASKPLDKVSILRLSASWMRLNYSCLNAKRFKSAVVNYLDMHHSLVTNLDILEKSINGFIIATTFSGVILMCSRYSEEYIGYQNIDLLGHHISNFVLPKEKDLLLKKMRNLMSKYKNGSSNPRNVVRVRMQQRPLPRSSEVRYRKMSFSLSIHSGDEIYQNPVTMKKNFKSGRQKDFGESAVILIFAEPAQLEPNIDVQYLEQKDCYFTIHGTQGEIIFADHRISVMTGYMPRDVLGNSAYQYIHCSDVPIALFAQKAMFASSDGTGIITYRLRIRDSSYIYLQTKGQIRYKDSTKEVRQFICCNILLSEEDGSRELSKFQDRYAPQLNASKLTLPVSKSRTKPTEANTDNHTTRENHSIPVEHEKLKQGHCLPATNGSISDTAMEIEEINTPVISKNSRLHLHLNKINYKSDDNQKHSLSSNSDISPLSSADYSPISSAVNPFRDASQAIQIINFNEDVPPEPLSCPVQCYNEFSSFDHLSPVQNSPSSIDASASFAEPAIQENGQYTDLVKPIDSTFLTSDMLLIPDDFTSYDTVNEKPLFPAHKLTGSQDFSRENVDLFNIEMVQEDFLIPQDAFQNSANISPESLIVHDETLSRYRNGHGSVNNIVGHNQFSTFDPKTANAVGSQSALKFGAVSDANKSILGSNSRENIDLSFLDLSVDSMALLSDLSDFYENSMSLTKTKHNKEFQSGTDVTHSSETEMNGARDFGVTNYAKGACELGLFTQPSSDLHISSNAHPAEQFSGQSNDSYFISDKGHSVETDGMQMRTDYFQTREGLMNKSKTISSSTKQKINDHIYSQFQTNSAINNEGRVCKVSKTGINHIHPGMNPQSALNHAHNDYAVMDGQPNTSLYSSLKESKFKTLK